MGAFDKKLYICEIVWCGRKTPIRSAIRQDGEFKGLKACPGCKQRYDRKVVKKVATKNRESYSWFFDAMIKILVRNPKCENCGSNINYNFMPHSNIAHILPKQKYKSVATNENNIMFLCAGKSDSESNNCHHKFDSDISGRVKMPIWESVVKRFQLFKDEITETKGSDYLMLEKEDVHKL